MKPLRVTCRLAGPLAGDPPQLDALLEWAMMPAMPAVRGELVAPGAPPTVLRPKLERRTPLPRVDESWDDYLARWGEYSDLPLAEAPWGQFGEGRCSAPVPVARTRVGGWNVARCSDPILPEPRAETVEHVCKRIATEEALLLGERERKVVTTTNSWTKSYRLPLRVRRVDRVVWFCVGDGKKVRRLLRREVRHVGKKVADGYGLVREWLVEDADADLSWYAPHANGRVLMRTLPAGPHLPRDLLGSRRDFGACAPPYWHPDRFGEIIKPC